MFRRSIRLSLLSNENRSIHPDFGSGCHPNFPMTATGNIDTIVKLLEQTGLRDYKPPTPTVSLNQQILLFHNNLITGDQIHTAKQWRSIETSPWNGLQFVVFIMGLFHIKMVCAETVWQTFLKDSKAWLDKTSFYSDFASFIIATRVALHQCSSYKSCPVHDAIRHTAPRLHEGPSP